MTERQIIAAAYDTGVAEELNRLSKDAHRRCEFSLVSQTVKLLVPPGSTIIDVGAGPGRYSEWLLKRDYFVGVVDLSEKSLKSFSERIMLSAPRLLFNEVCCATSMGWITRNSADGILLMGPMYHLPAVSDREKTIIHCFNILKPGGFLFAAFLNTTDDENQSGEVCGAHEQDRSGFVLTYTNFQGYSVPQSRCGAVAAGKLLESCGFSVKAILDIERVGSVLGDFENKPYFNRLIRQTLFDAFCHVSFPQIVLSAGRQFLCVAQKV